MAQIRYRRGCAGRILAGLALAATLVACGSDGRTWAGRDDAEEGRMVVMSMSGASESVPGFSLTDWVTYADRVVVATVLEEREIPPTPEELEAGEGWVGREVRLRIDRTLWRGHRDDEPPDPFWSGASGWVFKGDQRSRMRTEGSAYLTVGRSYLLPLADLGPGTGWGSMDPDGEAEVVAGRLVLDDPNGALPKGPLAELAGLDLDEIEARLTATDPLEEALPYLERPSRERFSETQAAVDAAAGYAPDGTPLQPGG